MFPNKGASVFGFPNVDFGRGVDVPDKLNNPLLGLVVGLLVSVVEVSATSFLVVEVLLFGLLPLVNFARKSKDVFCVLLKPLNPLNTFLLG